MQSGTPDITQSRQALPHADPAATGMRSRQPETPRVFHIGPSTAAASCVALQYCVLAGGASNSSNGSHAQLEISLMIRVHNFLG